MGWECQVCGWLGVCSPEGFTGRSDEWHCWLGTAIAHTGKSWEVLGSGGGIPGGKATLICLNLRDNAFPFFEIQHFSGRVVLVHGSSWLHEAFIHLH